jgi:hypothetical protein
VWVERTNDDNNKRRRWTSREERWRRMLKRVKYDLWALEPSEWLRGGKRKGG